MNTTTTSTPTSYRATARRSEKMNAYRTAAPNTQYRRDIQRVHDRQQQQTVIGEWKRYILARMFKDRTGVYHPFALNNLREELASTTHDTLAQRRRILTTVCETATLVLNPKLSKSNRKRHPATESCGIIVLPATNINGPHLHGFIRTPREYPHGHQVVQSALMTAFKTKNCWVPDVTELQQDGKSLDYLSKDWKQEERDWNGLEFLPALVFKRLVKLERKPISPPKPVTARLVTRRKTDDRQRPRGHQAQSL